MTKMSSNFLTEEIEKLKKMKGIVQAVKFQILSFQQIIGMYKDALTTPTIQFIQTIQQTLDLESDCPNEESDVNTVETKLNIELQQYQNLLLKLEQHLEEFELQTSDDNELVTLLIRILKVFMKPVLTRTHPDSFKSNENGTENNITIKEDHMKDNKLYSPWIKLQRLTENDIVKSRLALKEHGTSISANQDDLTGQLCFKEDYDENSSTPPRLTVSASSDSEMDPDSDSDRKFDGQFKCEICFKQFSTKGSLTRHGRLHNKEISSPNRLGQMTQHENNNFDCPQCPRKFIRKIPFEKHLKSHDVIEGNGLSCKVCRKEFSTEYNLNDHVKSHHQQVTLTCSICSQSFDGKKKYRAHLKTHSENLNCNFCDKSFTSTKSKRIHLKIHTQEKVNCDICSKLFSSKHNLNVHRMTHFPHLQKMFLCPECGVQFNRHHTLKTHMLLHGDNLPHACSKCDRAFRHRASLKQHFERWHEIKKYLCAICGKNFANKEDMNQHLDTHAKTKNYNCPVCLKLFKHKNSLKVHKRVHRGGGGGKLLLDQEKS